MNRKLENIWEGSYPLIIYSFLLTFIVTALNNYTKLDNMGSMLVQTVGKTVCILPMIYFFNKGPKLHGRTKQKVKDAFFILLVAICLNIAFNNIISLTPLKEWSEGYGNVESQIYSATLFWQVISVGILSPILEELVFRGIAFKNYRAAVGSWPAIIVSSIIFGVMHNNLVQFVYAFLLGIFFAYIYDKTGELWTCIWAHVVANLWSLFSTKLGITQWMFSDMTICLFAGIAALIIGVVILVKWKKL